MKFIFTHVFLLISALHIHAQNLYFPPVTGDEWDTLSPDSMKWCDENITKLYDFLDENNTKAFILLKDGKIVLEKYFGDHNQNSYWYWASAGKTLTAFMVGLAQQEGFLDINDKTSDYLGSGWTDCTLAQEDKITIRHQLTMTTGLDDGVDDPYCTLKNCLVYKSDADTRWAYHNAPYTLLDDVILKATGTNLNNYIIQKLRNKTGFSGLFFTSGYNNVFTSTARSMARFGLLILNKGNWDGKQIMADTNYFHDMTYKSQDINEAYGYLWWLNGSNTFMVPGSQFKFPGSMAPDAPSDMISALGKNGQFLNVVSGKNLVWLRMGDASDNSEVSFLLNNKIWKYINELECSSSNIDENQNVKLLTIFPNPAFEKFSVFSDNRIVRLDIMTYSGILIKSIYENFQEIDISDLKTGFYLLKISDSNGVIHNIKLIKSK